MMGQMITPLEDLKRSSALHVIDKK